MNEKSQNQYGAPSAEIMFAHEWLYDSEHGYQSPGSHVTSQAASAPTLSLFLPHF